VPIAEGLLSVETKSSRERLWNEAGQCRDLHAAIERKQVVESVTHRNLVVVFDRFIFVVP
jgi:hypothetical protein